MTEQVENEAIYRETTPTQQMLSPNGSANESTEISKKRPSGTSVFYDPNISSAQTALEALDTPRGLMPGDANRAIQDPSRPSTSDQQMSNRRRSPRSPPTHQRPSARPVQPSPSNYPPNADNIVHPVPSVSPFQHYPTPPLPYDQRIGYRPYTMSAQPHPGMEHTPTSPFAYSHPYPHPGLSDNNLISQNIHANYQPMLQPPSSAYPFQQHSPEGSSSAHHSFAASSPSSMYGHHQVTPSPPVHSPVSPAPTSPSGSHTPYAATANFHTMNYSTAMTTPSYSYPPPQAYSASPPMYSHFTPAPYGQHHFAPSPEADRQGGWWYLPHGPALSRQQQHDGGTASFQAPYLMSYSMHQEHEPYPVHTPSSPTSSSAYPISPIRPLSPESRPISAPASGTGPSPEVDGRPPPQIAEKPIARRAYHPNPPAHRSEWVMWAGNVPSDAVHDELWRFFNRPPESGSDPSSSSSSPSPTGVLSIFLISRSSCAFVNFESEYHLHQAIERFNGQALRPLDPRCPRLVCRVRKKDDDLKAGVGGQRGFGLHSRWVKEQKEKAAKEISDTSDVSASDDRPSTGSTDQLARGMSSLSVSSDEDPRHGRPKHSGSSGSHASTNSSLLTRYFPQRYFILKSLTQYDLDLSVEKGLWATQKHNEGILDQAYRTSQDVFLIFSVNKSGEFYGYARMAGPIRRGEHRVSWATRATTDSSASSRSSLSSAIGRSSALEDAEDDSNSSGKGPHSDLFVTPSAHPLMEASPEPFSGIDENEYPGHLPVPSRPPIGPTQSAPAELGHAHRKMTLQTPLSKHSLDYKILGYPTSAADGGRLPESEPASRLGFGSSGAATLPSGFSLDPSGPIRAMRGASSGDSPERGSSSLAMPTVVEEEERDMPETTMGEGEVTGHDDQGKEGQREDWGESFKIEWLSREKLPFHRTRNLRNPWNHDREIKVSRDGTELEPAVGRKLLEEWARLADPSSSSSSSTKQTGSGASAASTSKRGSRSAAPAIPAATGSSTGAGRQP